MKDPGWLGEVGGDGRGVAGVLRGGCEAASESRGAVALPGRTTAVKGGRPPPRMPLPAMPPPRMPLEAASRRHAVKLVL